MSKIEEKSTKRRNGEGTFYDLPSGKRGYRVMVGYHDDGKPRYVSVSGTSDTDCLRKMKARLREEERNPQVNCRKGSSYSEMTLEELCWRNLYSDMANPRKALKMTSADRRRCTINNQIAKYPIAGLKATEVSSLDVEEHIEELLATSLSPSSVEKVFFVINAAYKWGIKKDMVRKNPCDGIVDDMMASFDNLKRRDSASGVIRVLSFEDEKRVLETAKMTWGANKRRYNAGNTVIFLNETAIRAGELCALRLRHWNRINRTIDIELTRHLVRNLDEKAEVGFIPVETIVKNAHRRTLELSDIGQAILEEIIHERPDMQPDDYFFLNRAGNPTEPSALGKSINRIFVAAGLRPEERMCTRVGDVSGAHIFRRTYATRKYKEGCSVEDIAAFLGDDPGTVLKYYIDRTEKITDGDSVQNYIKIPQKR